MTSHLVSNETFRYLHVLSGMHDMRQHIARELLREAVKKLAAEAGINHHLHEDFCSPMVDGRETTDLVVELSKMDR